MKYTFLNLARDTLDTIGRPLSAKEIWEQAKLLGFIDRLSSFGKTPDATVGARIYMDIKENPNSEFVKVSKGKFCLKNFMVEPSPMQMPNRKVSTFNERDLHILLSTFVHSSPNFRCYTKTIYHEKSNKGGKGRNKWLHPDMVGIYYPFDDYQEETIITMKSLGENPCKVFSFELKVNINASNLRECFFQAVSNSSWANEGYLVTLTYDDNILDEMRRLNNAFGIGLVALNLQNVKHSKIVFNAKEKTSLDWDMINRLTEENDDFKGFICTISEDLNLRKVKNPKDYDVYFSDDLEVAKYINSKRLTFSKENTQ